MARPPFADQPTLIGHRGMGKGVVDGHEENTIGSFQAALRAGLGWVEIDVRRTQDDALVVAHDDALPDGSFLAELTTERATSMGAVPLEEVLEALPDSAGVVLDVKSSLHDAGRGAGHTTAAVLASRCAGLLGERPALVLSFDPAALNHLRTALPTMAVGLLTWHTFPIGQAVAAAAHLDVDVLAVHAGSLWRNAHSGPAEVPALQQVVDRVHEAKRQLLVWCPSERRARALATAGVDAMVVDEVPRHLRLVSRTANGARA